MRIRRRLATTSDLLINSSDPADINNKNNLRRCSSSTSKTSIIVCVLNQSPWDVADLASFKLDGGIFSLTGTCAVPELAKGSQSLCSSVKLSVQETKQQLGGAAASDKYSDRRENSVGLSPSEVKIRAEKSKKSGVELSSDKPQIRSSIAKKQQRESNDSTPQPGMKRRGRPAKRLPANNPNEFYYYSGFGPQWSKKRENLNKPPAAGNKSVVANQELPNGGSERRDIEFVEYDEDDDDDGKEEDAEEGRRHGGRKRVKARSLKSLM